MNNPDQESDRTTEINSQSNPIDSSQMPLNGDDNVSHESTNSEPAFLGDRNSQEVMSFLLDLKSCDRICSSDWSMVGLCISVEHK